MHNNSIIISIITNFAIFTECLFAEEERGTNLGETKLKD